MTKHQLPLLTETWEEKARRLAKELRALRESRDLASPTSKAWTNTTKAIRDKRYEIECHLALVGV